MDMNEKERNGLSSDAAEENTAGISDNQTSNVADAMVNDNGEATADTADKTEETAAEETAEIRIDESRKADKPKKEKLHSAFRLKYGSFATAITAIFLAAVILLNVAISVLNERFPMTIDMTGDGVYTVSADNAEFLKTIDYPVELKVLFTEEQYTGGYIAYYHSVTDNSGGRYYKQTVDLLKQYKKYNKNISLTFVDPYNDAEVSTIVQDYSEADLSVNYGDILVECYVDGKDKAPKLGVIPFEDCYQLDSDQNASLYNDSSYESFTLNGNKVEQAVANGIFKTVNLTTVNVAMLTMNSTEEYITNFKDICKQNAFNIINVPVLGDADLSKYDVMMICAPNADYTADEIKIIEKWLDNDGKKGKTVLFFASAGSPKLPNLYAFLEEWGIAVEQGERYYSKDSRYYSTDRTNIYLESCNTEYTVTVDKQSYSFISNNMLPLSAVYENEPNGSRSVTTLLQTMDTATYIKPDNDKSWSPSGAGGQLPALMLSKDADDGNGSYVVAAASIDYLTNSHTVTKTDNGNYKLLINVLNATARSDEDVFVMETKVVSDSSGAFTSSTTSAQSLIIGIVFIALIPAGLIVAAIAVYMRRKNH